MGYVHRKSVMRKGYRQVPYRQVRQDHHHHIAIRPKKYMKYLGVLLDCKLNFKQHFKYIDEKVGKVTRALGRLMPNLRGPSEKKRRLYAGIIASVVLYAAPFD